MKFKPTVQYKVCSMDRGVMRKEKVYGLIYVWQNINWRSTDWWGLEGACITGLELASELEIYDLILESDSLLVVTFLIKQVEKTDNDYTLVVRECTLLTRYWKVKLQHTFNSTADWLANSLGYFSMKNSLFVMLMGFI